MSVDLIKKLSSQMKRLLLCIYPLAVLPGEKLLQVQGFGYLDVDLFRSIEEGYQSPDVPGL